MGIRYCIHCGMPIPRKVKVCPECGTSQIISAPRNDLRSIEMPQFSQKKAVRRPDRGTRRGQQKPNRFALLLIAGFLAVFCITVFFVVKASDEIKNARSRHRENMLDSQRTRRPVISIPDISMPDISFPDIRLPEPPPATFAAAGYETETDLTGEMFLNVNIYYTNIAEERQCFLTNFRISVQQEGKACRQTVSTAKENRLMGYVQPDETALISEAFFVTPEKEATVTVSALFGADIYLEETVLPHADGTVTVCE